MKTKIYESSHHKAAFSFIYLLNWILLIYLNCVSSSQNIGKNFTTCNVPEMSGFTPWSAYLLQYKGAIV